MLFVKIGSGKYLKRIEAVEWLDKGDMLVLVDGNTVAQYRDEKGWWIVDPDRIVEADESKVVQMFPMAENSRWYKWKEETEIV